MAESRQSILGMLRNRNGTKTHLYLFVVFVTLLVQPVAMAATFDDNTNREVTITTSENVELNGDQNKRLISNSAANELLSIPNKPNYDATGVQDIGLSSLTEPYNPLGHITNGQSPQDQLNLGWNELSTNMLGLANPIPTMDLDGDNLPEIFTTGKADGTPQFRGEAGFTKILEYDPTTNNFSVEIYNEYTPTPYFYYSFDPFGNNTVYFIRDVNNVLTASDQVTVVKWDVQAQSLVTVSNQVTFEDWTYFYNQYDFNLNGLNEIFSISGPLEGNQISRLELTSNGILTKITTPSNSWNTGMIIEDLDNDNEMEIAISSKSLGLSVYNYNPGNNTFSQSFNVDLGNNHQELWTWDYDNDGLLNIFVSREAFAGSDLEIINYQWDGVSSYVLDPKSLVINGLKRAIDIGQARPSMDILGNGQQLTLIEGERGTGSGVNEIGYITLSETNFEYNLIASVPNSNQLSINQLQIDNDPSVEFLISYLNSVDSKVYSRLTDKESDLSHLAYYENFNDDVFTSSSWSRSDPSVTVNTGQSKLIMGSGGPINDYFEYTDLPSDFTIIEMRSRTDHYGYGTPQFTLRDDADTESMWVSYIFDPANRLGWRLNPQSWTTNMKGPQRQNTWLDFKLVRDNNNITVYAKTIDSQIWTYIDEGYFTNFPTKIKVYQINNEITEIDYIKIYTSGSQQGPTEKDSYVEYVESQNKVYWFGGLLGSTYYDETWVYDVPTSTWTNITTVVRPIARYAHDIVYDEESERIILFGGNNGANLGDTWSFNVNTYNWTNMNPATAPSARGWFGFGYDNINDVIILHGGTGSNSETWSYDYNSNTWTNMNPVTPPMRTQHRIIFDESIGKFIMFGGATYTDTWSYDYLTNTWLNLNPSNNPSDRNQGQLWYDARTQNIFLYSGYLGINRFNDTWVYNSKINNWRQVALRYSTMKTTLSNGIVYVNELNRALMFYPYFDETGANERTVYSFDFDQNTWFGNVTDLAGNDSVYDYVINDHFDQDISITGWTTSDATISTNTNYGIARINAGGGNSDYLDHTLSGLQTPFVVEYRGKLVSGGNNYRLPAIALFYPNGSTITTTYISPGAEGWLFGRSCCTANHDFAPTAENQWFDIKILFETSSMSLYSRSSASSDYNFVMTKNIDNANFSLVRLSQPWDSPNEFDYLRIYNNISSYDPLKQDLWAYYDFNEGSGTTLIDQSGSGNDGILVNGPAYIQGVQGGALSFDGIDDYIDLGFPVYRDDNVSIAFWLNPHSTDDQTYFASITSTNGHNSINFGVKLNKFFFNVYNSTGLPSQHNSLDINLDEWIHLVEVKDKTNGKVSFYVNGNLLTELNWDGGSYYFGNPTYNTYVGAPNWALRDPAFTPFADIDELRIYNKTLSPSDVSNLYALHYVPILDTTSPTLDSPLDVTYQEDGTASITWTVADSNPDTYTIARNGTTVDTGTWTNGSIAIDVSGLLAGVYAFIITVYDTLGNSTSDTVFVTVTDPDPPALDSPTDATFELGSSSNFIVWTTGDRHPGNYRVEVDGVQTIGLTAWINGTISVPVDTSATGVYSYVIFVYDVSGNVITDPVTITIEDTVNPVITSPADVNYYETATGNSISWDLTELDPTTYAVYRNGTQVATNTYVNGGTVSVNIDGLTIGVYNLTIQISDGSGNWISDLVWVTVLDDLVDPVYTIAPSDSNYEFGTATHTISWTGTDIHADTYVLYVNGVLDIASTAWISGSAINYDAGGLSLGIHNISIVLFDTFGNSILDTIFITVSDTTVPNITGPADLSYAEFTTGNSLSWDLSDLDPDTYIIYFDSVESVSATVYSSGGTIIFDVDGLSVGSYNVTILVFDGSGNWSSDTAFVTIQGDATVPDINSPLDVTSEVGQNTTLLWIVGDEFPAILEIYWDGTLYFTDSQWYNGTYNMSLGEEFPVGTYNVTIIVYDSRSNWSSDTLFLTLEDTVAPTVNGDISITASQNQSSSVTWIISDFSPNYFELYGDGVLVNNFTWNEQSFVFTHNFTKTDLGSYNFTIKAYDAYGFMTEYSTSIEIVYVDTTLPIVLPVGDVYVDYSITTGAFAIFLITEDNPSTAEFYINGTLISSGPYDTLLSLDQFAYNVSGFEIGFWNLTLVVKDAFGNSGRGTIIVNVETIESDPPVIVEKPEDQILHVGDEPMTYTWLVEDQYLYEVKLYVDGTEINESSYSIYEGTTSSQWYVSYNFNATDVNDVEIYIVVNDRWSFSTQSTSVWAFVLPPVTELSPDIREVNDLAIAINEGKLELSWIVNEDNPRSFQFTIDGIAEAEKTWDGSIIKIKLNLQELGLGLHTVTLRVTNLDDYESVFTMNIMIVAGAPSLSDDGFLPGFTFEILALLATASLLLRRRKF